MKANYVIMILTALVCALRAWATGPQAITGTVVDSRDSAIAFANVMLLDRIDSVIMAGTVTDDQGRFMLKSEKDGILHVTCLGYRGAYVNNPYQGRIVLQQDSMFLDEITVTGTVSMTRIKGNSMVTTVQGTHLEHLGSAHDVLAKLPGIVSNHGKIEVIGKGAPLIYINGKKVRDLSEVERLVPAMIKEIEVNTTPGAEHDATAAAVVRIQTVRPAGEGFGGSSRTVVGVRHYVYGLEEMNFNYRKGELDVFGTAAYNSNRDREDNETDLYTFSATPVRQHVAGHESSRQSAYAGKLGFNYAFGGKHSLGLTYDFSYTPVKRHFNSSSQIWLADALSDELSNTSLGKSYNYRHLVNGYYDGRFGGWQVNVNMDALRINHNSHKKEKETSRANEERVFRTSDDYLNCLYAAKAVASHSLFSGSVTVGTEWTYNHRVDEFKSGMDFLSDVRTKIDENNGALFVETMQSFGRLTTMAGLRWEHVDSRYHENGQKIPEPSRSYDNLFPSLSFIYPVKNVHTVLSYARKVRRPPYAVLTSNTSYVNRYTYEMGNPYLKPSYTDDVTITGNWKWLMFQLGYDHISHPMMSVYSQNIDNPEIVLIQRRNSKSYDSFMAMVFLAPTIGAWHPQMMGAVTVQNLSLDYNGARKYLDNPLGIVKLNNAIELPHGFWLDLNFSWRTSGDTENMHIGSTWQTDIGVSKSFSNDRWNVVLQCDDLFKTDVTKASIYSNMNKMHLKKTNDSRNLSLTVRYNFNAAKSKYKGTGAGNSEKQRF